MSIRNLSNSELSKLSAIETSDIEAKFLAIEELSRRQAKRQFLWGTLVAWFAMLVALCSLILAIAAYQSNNVPSKSGLPLGGPPKLPLTK